MKKQELLNYFNDELLEKLYGFCYARTADSYEAQELCSDIVFAIVKSANAEGEIENPYPFIWRVARNVYAQFSDKRKRHDGIFYEGDPEEIFPFISDENDEDEGRELICAVYRRIAFLTRAYREVMIMFYIDGLSTAKIAECQKTSEGAVRQRLFSARKKVKSEVEKMSDTNKRPVALDKIDFVIWGTGNPCWGDPRNECSRQFSKQIVHLCRKKPMSALEIAEELNVPTVYVEEELDIQTKGENGKYGLLRRLDNGKYAINFILLDKDEVEKAHGIYNERLPMICNVISDFIDKRKDDYLAFPYLNKKIDLNLVLWQQVYTMSHVFGEKVEEILSDKYFAGVEKVKRPFSVFGYVDNGKHYGGGWDGVVARNVCGFSEIRLDNIYIKRIKKHFGCGHNIASDSKIQLALRSINGLDVGTLSEDEKEHAAKAIECGYLYREGNMLWTKILVNDMKDADRLFDISDELSNGYFDAEAQAVAVKVAELIRRSIPDYLLGEWRFFNRIAGTPLCDGVVESLIEKGIIMPPDNGVGAEGCWMGVSK